MIAGLGVAAGLDRAVGSLAAGYVLLLALFGPVLMKYSDVLIPVIDMLDRALERGLPRRFAGGRRLDLARLRGRPDA